MKVNIHHFGVIPEKPEESIYESKGFSVEQFEDDIKEWVSKFEEPTHDWIELSKKKPKKNQSIILLYKSNAISYIKDDPMLYNRDWLKQFIFKWCDAESHDAKVKIYEDHKQIFFGWEHTSGLGNDYFEKEGSIITIYGDGSVLYEAEDTHLFIEIGDCIEVDELQLICKNRGIEL